MFFTRIERLFDCQDFGEFHESFLALYDDFMACKINVRDDLFVRDASYFCQRFLSLVSQDSLKLTHPTRIRRPNHAKSPLALAKILHSVAHIEACAIVLSLDSCYRFRALPRCFYEDWLEVAREEIAHFELLAQLLRELGVRYGDFIIHHNLFDALILTQESLEIRMGIVHRGLEARGLDANPFVLKKLMQTPLDIKSKIKEAFDVILRDEISHVSKGDRWWKYSSTKSFLELCQQFSQFSLAGPIINTEARIQAGFLQAELESLQKFYENQH